MRNLSQKDNWDVFELMKDHMKGYLYSQQVSNLHFLQGTPEINYLNF